MARFNLDSLFEQENTVEQGLAGKTILIYGSNNVGKTYVCSKLPKPLFICTEAGAGAINAPKIACPSWERLCEVVEALTKDSDKEKNMERIKTVVIDTLDQASSLAEQAVLDEFEVRALSEMDSKTNGYTLARGNFKRVISKLANYGYCVVFIAHDTEKEMSETVNGVINKYNYTLPIATDNKKTSAAFVRDFSDFTFYVKSNGVDENGKVIRSTAYTAETKYFFARSRFGEPPFAFEFTADNVVNVIENAVKQTAEEEGMNLTSFSEKSDTYSRDDLVGMISEIAKDSDLMAIHGKRVVDTVKKYLGDKKLSQTTEADVPKLRDCYNSLILLRM